MAQITNAELKRLLDDLAKRVGGLEVRMETYEQQAKENSAILKQVAVFFAYLKHVVRFLKWCGGIIAASALTAAATYAVQHLIAH